MSSITLAELLHDVEKSSRPDHNLFQVKDFCSRLEVLPYGNKATLHYGSNNLREFERVVALRVINWA